MITDADITKLKKALKEDFATKDDLKKFATKSDLKKFATKDALEELRSDMRVGFGDVNDKIDTLALAIGQIQNTLDGMAGAIRDQWVEHGAGNAHLQRHDRQISTLALATNVSLPD